MSEVIDRYTGLLRVDRMTPGGMVALKGDLSDPALARALKPALGCAVPPVRHWLAGKGGRALWMAPDELLLMVPDPGATIARLDKALAGSFVTLADVSDLRARFALTGAAAPDVLAKLCPVDFGAFPPGSLRRTRAAQASVLIWRDEGARYGLLCARSVADYMADLLRMAARPGGEVGLYR